MGENSSVLRDQYTVIDYRDHRLHRGTKGLSSAYVGLDWQYSTHNLQTPSGSGDADGIRADAEDSRSPGIAQAEFYCGDS